MKKMQILIISLLFLITNNSFASFLQNPNPYSFGPQGRSVSDLRSFSKPKYMARVLPNRPVVATDSEGNRVYYTPDGKMTLSVSKDGSMSFSLSGVTKSMNASGEYSGITRTLRGENLLQEVRNKDDQIIGYKTLNGDGKVSRTFDKDKNLTATYVYKGQGAKLDYVQNEMTKGRTYYDDFGRTKYETDADGFVLNTYQYQDVSYERGEDGKSVVEVETEGEKGKGLLVSKKTTQKDLYRNIVFSTTYFDQKGNITKVTDANGIITSEYHYKNDDKGNLILDYVLDNNTKQKTFFDENGNRDYTVDEDKRVVARYFDSYVMNIGQDGSYTVTRYDIDGKELYTTFQNVEYDENDGTITIVRDVDGEISEEYVYDTDDDGKKYIKYVIRYNDPEYGTTYTWYDPEGRPEYTTKTDKRPVDDNSDDIVKDFSWNGNTLIYTFDRKTGHTSYYNMDKELVYVAFNDRIVSKKIYSRGRLVGSWDAQNEKLTVYINERDWLTFDGYGHEPTEGEVRYILANSARINVAVEKQKVAGGIEGGTDSISNLDSLDDAWLKDVLNNPNYTN